MRKSFCALTSVLFALLWVFPAPVRAGGGLYDDDAKHKAMKTGDIDSQDYWWTKFDMTMLDMAIAQHQPEGRIGTNLISTQERLDKLAKDYPAHEEIKAWKEKVEAIKAKIDPKADTNQYFKPGCPWEEPNFAQAWVNYHWAKMEIAEKNIDNARGLLQNVSKNLELLTAPDRMKDYPEELRKWVTDAQPEVEKMRAELKRR